MPSKERRGRSLTFSPGLRARQRATLGNAADSRRNPERIAEILVPTAFGWRTPSEFGLSDHDPSALRWAGISERLRRFNFVKRCFVKLRNTDSSPHPSAIDHQHVPIHIITGRR